MRHDLKQYIDITTNKERYMNKSIFIDVSQPLQWRVDDVLHDIVLKSFYFADNILLVEIYFGTNLEHHSYEYYYEIKDDRVVLTNRYDIYTQDLDKDSELRLRAFLKKEDV